MQEDSQFKKGLIGLHKKYGKPKQSQFKSKDVELKLCSDCGEFTCICKGIDEAIKIIKRRK